MKTLKLTFILGLSVLALETAVLADTPPGQTAPAPGAGAVGPVPPPCISVSGKTGGNDGQGTDGQKKSDSQSGNAGK